MSFKKRGLLSLVAASTLMLCSGLAFANNFESVSATGFDEDKNHRPENMIDGNIKTRWAVNGLGNSATLKLKSDMKISNIVLIPFKPTERRLKFDLSTSTDNSTWTPLASGLETSDKYDKGEKFVLKTPRDARYLKIDVNGTNANKWSALIEVDVNSSEALPETMLP